MNKKFTFVLLILILLLAAFFRLYRISDYMTFLGDEGRDALIAKGILEGHLTLLGPRSSAGDFFMGPVYYYMITPFLWLFRLDPVGPAVMVALFGVATVFLVYWVGKRFFDEKAGLFAAALYAVSPLVIAYSHSSWNPDVLPFFALLFIYLLFKSIASARPWKYFLVDGFLLGICLQLHYLSLFLGVIAAVYIFVAEWKLFGRILPLQLIKHYLLFFVGFLIGLSPFLAFEIRHGFPNTRTIADFILNGTGSTNYTYHGNFFTTAASVYFRIFGRLIFNFPTPDRYHFYPLITLQLWGLLIVLTSLCAITTLYFIKNKFVFMLLFIWLFVCILLFGFYKQPIYDYHFTLLFPLPFLLFGYLFSYLYQQQEGKKIHSITILLSIVLFLGLFSYNLSDYPFKYPPNKQKDQTKQIAEFIISQTNAKPFNFALISQGNSDHAYRYYLEILGHKPVTIQNTIDDPQRTSVTDQLFVVCEDRECKPLGNPLFEVAGFGRGAIVKTWDVSVVKVDKLTHYTEYTIH